MSDAPLAELAFTGEVIEWRGPAPFYFVAIPPEHSGAIRHAARQASYGWGVVPVRATLGDGAAFTTSLFPRQGDYLLPLKNAVRRAAEAMPGDTVEVALRIDASAPRR